MAKEDIQLHAGRYYSDTVGEWRPIWHTHSDGNWWSGWMPQSITPNELLMACVSTLFDLVRIYPDLMQEMMKIIEDAKRRSE